MFFWKSLDLKMFFVVMLQAMLAFNSTLKMKSTIKFLKFFREIPKIFRSSYCFIYYLWTAASAFSFPTDIYLFKVTFTLLESCVKLCSKLTIKTPERHHWCRFGVFLVNFKHISSEKIFLLLTSSMYLIAGLLYY